MDAAVRTDNALRAENAFVTEAIGSGVSWASIAAGAVAAAALTLALLALGAGLGLSSIGGYLAARLRTRWVGLHTNEVFFRDTAHGFIAWAFATLLSARRFFS